MGLPELPFPPRSQAAIEKIQSQRKKVVFAAALKSRLWAGRLHGIDADRLDDPDEWRKIPILTKDDLRRIAPEAFLHDFCTAPRGQVIEYWRSGGSTGQPLFYPRSAVDMRFALEGFCRLWRSAGCGPGDLAHISFPLGIHPVGHAFARAAEAEGIGTVWCGSGNNTPSELQIELIRTLKPDVWCGMASYGLHLAEVAERVGFDLAASSVSKLMNAAEALSPAKRAKIEALWGAEIYNQYGITEGTAMASEGPAHDGFHLWTDMVHAEVIDTETGTPVADGEVGTFIVTPLFTNHMTPFLRWNTGDLVIMRAPDGSGGEFSVFPRFWHTQRTQGFFKVRGININHVDFEELMHGHGEVADFKLEVVATDTLDLLRLSIELRPGTDGEATLRQLSAEIRNIFELSPEITVVDKESLAGEVLADVKARRFLDLRPRD